jgi:hypothetical protein
MGHKDGGGAHPKGFFTKGVVPEAPGGGLKPRPAGAGIGFNRSGPYAVNPQGNGKGFTQGDYVPLVLKTFFPAADIVVNVQAVEGEQRPSLKIRAPGGIPDCPQRGGHSRGIGAARQGREEHRTGLPGQRQTGAKGGEYPFLKAMPEIFRLHQPTSSLSHFTHKFLYLANCQSNPITEIFYMNMQKMTLSP